VVASVWVWVCDDDDGDVDEDGGPSETTRADVKRRIANEEDGAGRPWLASEVGRGGRGGRRSRVRLLDDIIGVPVPCLPETRKTLAHIRWEGWERTLGKKECKWRPS
jgi:hypothetical protein